MDNYSEFMLYKTYQEIDSINESKFDIKSKFVKLLKLSLRKGMKNRRRIVLYGLASLIAVSSVAKVSDIFNNDIELQELSVEAGVDKDIEKELSKDTASYKEPEVKKSTGGVMRISQNCWDFIKELEGDPSNKGEPILTAYKDSYMITVGWGHAQRRKKSTHKIGDKITKEQAQEYLKQDLKVAADGIRRMIKQWDDKGIKVELTQGQLDALTSLAFNAGVGSVRKSPMMRHLKKGDVDKAAESIKKFKVSKKHSGLYDRRIAEYNMFVS